MAAKLTFSVIPGSDDHAKLTPVFQNSGFAGCG